jgi:hypothetical protein
LWVCSAYRPLAVLALERCCYYYAWTTVLVVALSCALLAVRCVSVAEQDLRCAAFGEGSAGCRVDRSTERPEDREVCADASGLWETDVKLPGASELEGLPSHTELDSGMPKQAPRRSSRLRAATQPACHALHGVSLLLSGSCPSDTDCPCTSTFLV